MPRDFGAGIVVVPVVPDVTGFGREMGRRVASVAVPDVDVPVDPDVTGFGRRLAGDLGRHGRETTDAGRSIGQRVLDGLNSTPVVGAVTGFGAAIATGLMYAVNRSAELDAIQRRLTTVFAESTPQVRSFADTINERLGASVATVEGMAAAVGDLLVPMGFAREEAAGLSTRVVDLSGALRAWTGNTRSAQEVSDILTAALLGERDALQGLGVQISQADIDNRLLAQGQAELTGKEREQAEALVTLDLAYEKSSDAVVAWQNTQPGAASAMDTVKAAFGDITDSIVISFAPTLANLGKWVAENMPLIKERMISALNTAREWIANTLVPFIRDTLIPTLRNIRQWWDDNGPAITRGAESIANGVVRAFEVIDSIRRLFSDPFRWVIDNVVNPFIRALNDIPGVKLNEVRFSVPSGGGGGRTRGGVQEFALGGWVPGFGRRDTIPAMLTPGEFVVRRPVAQAVRGFLADLNAGRAEALMAAGRGRIPRFAQGGNVPGAMSFARAQAGKPYVWGAVGPGGYDCSGFLSAIQNVLEGRHPHSRRFTSASIGNASGYVRGGGGLFDVGTRRGVGRGSGGHVAGTLAGMNVEASGSRGSGVGPGVRGARDRYFNEVWTWAGGAGMGGAGGFSMSDWIASLIEKPIRTLRDAVAGLAARFGDVGDLVGSAVRAAVDPRKIAEALVDAVNPFGRGGIVTRPTLGLVGERGPEAVIPLSALSGTTDRQTAALERLVAILTARDGVTMNFPDVRDPYEAARRAAFELQLVGR